MSQSKVYTTWCVSYRKDAANPIEKIESAECFPWSPHRKSPDKGAEGNMKVVFETYTAASAYMEKLRKEAEDYERLLCEEIEKEKASSI